MIPMSRVEVASPILETVVISASSCLSTLAHSSFSGSRFGSSVFWFSTRITWSYKPLSYRRNILPEFFKVVPFPAFTPALPFITLRKTFNMVH